MNWKIVIFALWAMVLTVTSAPAPNWWDDLFYPGQARGYGNYGGYGGYGSNYRSGGFNQFPTNRQQRSGKEKYNALCRVLNPDPYAFPGKIPYPAAPLC